MDVVTMTHARLGERQVRREVVRKMRQNGWSLKTETATPKGKSSKESE